MHIHMEIRHFWYFSTPYAESPDLCEQLHAAYESLQASITAIDKWPRHPLPHVPKERAHTQKKEMHAGRSAGVQFFLSCHACMRELIHARN
uniref:Uncharacterized protein n=1 Tax=Oryza meridionalis TaxID=40149 RepID=A0A0E0DHM0_9ORYZ